MSHKRSLNWSQPESRDRESEDPYNCLQMNSIVSASRQIRGIADGHNSLTDWVFSTIKKSVISAPAWVPTPRPAVPMALGADHAEVTP